MGVGDKLRRWGGASSVKPTSLISQATMQMRNVQKGKYFVEEDVFRDFGVEFTRYTRKDFTES